MLTIFQLGNFVVPPFTEKWHGYATASDGKPESYLWAPGHVWPNKQFQPSVRKISIRVAIPGGGAFTPRQSLNRLNALVGLPIPLIAYFDQNDCKSACPDCPTNCECDLMWVSNTGVVTSVTETEFKNSKNYEEVAITVELGPFWTPLNKIFWEWTNSELDLFNPNAAPDVIPFSSVLSDFIKPYPNCDALIGCHDCWFWQRRPISSLFAYDSNAWFALANDPELKSCTQWIDFGSNQLSFSKTEQINIDRTLWNAPPLTVYSVFINQVIPGTTFSASLSIQSERNFQSLQTDVTTFDMASISAALVAAGLPAIKSKDRLIFGNVVNLPGFIVRDNGIFPATDYQVIESPRLPIDYPDSSAGQCYPGRNNLTLSATITHLNSLLVMPIGFVMGRML